MRWSLALVALSSCGRVAFNDVARVDANGPTDGDAATVAPCDVPDNTILCDDFEGTLDKWSSIYNATIVSSPTRTGAGALRASIPDGTGYSSVVATPAQLPTFTRLSVRFWMYITGPSSLAQANFMSLDDVQSSQELTLLGFNNELRLWRDTSSQGTYPVVVLPRDQWLCVELDARIDDVAGTLRASMNGVVYIDASATDTNGDGFDAFTFGLPFSDFPGQGAATIYYDDLHLGTQPVGCQ